MIGFAVLLGGAALGFGLARWLGLPATPFMLGAGFVLSAAGLLPEAEILQSVLILGVGFLLFAAGVELDIHRVGRYRRLALAVGLVQFFALGGVSLVVGLALGFPLLTSVYLALAMAASSTLVVVRLLNQRRQTFEPFGRMVIGVLLLQDLLVIVLAPVLLRAVEGVLSALVGLALTLALIALAYALQRWLVPRLVLRGKLDGESLLMLSVSILFGFIGLAHVFDLPMITGAFLAGFALSSFPVNGLVREQLTPVTDFFLPIFFTALGGIIIIPAGPTLLTVLAFVLVVVLVTPPVVTLIAERAGFPARSALESGLLLAQTSELSLIIGLLALTAGVLSADVFSVIVLVTAITMIATPFLATDANTWRLMQLHPSRLRERPAEPPRDHILLLGCGESGLPLLETLFLAGYEVFVVDDDPIVIENLQENDVPSMRGDASDLEVLAAAGGQNARVVIAMIRRPGDSAALVRNLGGVPVLVRVFTDEDAALVERHGGIPIRYADAAADAFLAWFESSEFAGSRRNASPSAIPSSHA